MEFMNSIDNKPQLKATGARTTMQASHQQVSPKARGDQAPTDHGPGADHIRSWSRYVTGGSRGGPAASNPEASCFPSLCVRIALGLVCGVTKIAVGRGWDCGPVVRHLTGGHVLLIR